MLGRVAEMQLALDVPTPTNPLAGEAGGPLPRVAVVVSELNSRRTIEQCLIQLTSQDYPPDRLSIVLVDAGSTDGTLDVAGRFESRGVRVIVSPRCTEFQGQVLGIRASSSEVIAFTNSDIYVPPNWVRSHVRWHESGFELVTGLSFYAGDLFNFVWNSRRPKLPLYRPVDGVALGFSNLSISRALYDRIGGMKDLASHHDTEMIYRAVTSGARFVTDPDSVVVHDHPLRSLQLCLGRSYGVARNQGALWLSHRKGQGAGAPIISPPVDMGYQLAESVGLLSAFVYRDWKWDAVARGMPVPFVRFMALRVVTRMTRAVGLLRGLTSHAPNESSMVDLHHHPSSSTTVQK